MDELNSSPPPVHSQPSTSPAAVRTGERPLVSVVVPALNCANDVDGFAACMRAQTYPADRFEVIVVDNGSSDDTLERARRAGLTVVLRPERGRSKALNAGLARARGEYILTTDLSCRAAADWIEAIVATFEAHPNAACVAGDIRLLKTVEGPAIRFQERTDYMSPLLALSRNRLPFLPFGDGANASFTRRLFEEIGGFEETFSKAADVEICYRLLVMTDYEIVFNRHALMWEPGEESLRALLRQRLRMGLGSCLLAQRFPGFYATPEQRGRGLRSRYWRWRSNLEGLLELARVNLAALFGHDRGAAEDSNIRFLMRVAQALGERRGRRQLARSAVLPQPLDPARVAAFVDAVDTTLRQRIKVVAVPSVAPTGPAG